MLAVEFEQSLLGPIPGGGPFRIVVSPRQKGGAYARKAYINSSDARDEMKDLKSEDDIGPVSVVAHEFGHAWWWAADPLTDNYWLAESMAEYTAMRYVEHQFGVEKRDERSDLGGTMRLGLQEQRLKPGTLARDLYGKDVVAERHRHRYEFNNRYRTQLEDAGLVIAAKSMDDLLVEMVELPRAVHPWFLACQAHPEFLSTPRDGHPLFVGFIRAAREKKAGGKLLKEARA